MLAFVPILAIKAEKNPFYSGDKKLLFTDSHSPEMTKGHKT